MIYGYVRVSTKGQIDNNSFEQQKREILTKYSSAVIYREQFTGTTTDRPVLNKLLVALEANDTLVITKLDRLARTTTEGLEVIDNLLKRNVSIHILNMGYIDNSPSSVLIYTIFLAFAKFERDMIVERTQTGKAIAKLDPDFREGRPKTYGEKQIAHALELLESKTYKQVGELTGMSKSTLIRAKREVTARMAAG